nr:hypothetical protein OADCBASZ_OADCBASZ_CDS_0006 [Microvirus sp.]
MFKVAECHLKSTRYGILKGVWGIPQIAQAQLKHKKRVKKALEADNDTTPPPPAE